MAGGIAIAIFGAAFVAAPRSCEGGFGYYFCFGVVAIVALLVLPFAMRIAESLAVRFACAAGFAVLGAATWVGGMVAANVRFLCRLF